MGSTPHRRPATKNPMLARILCCAAWLAPNVARAGELTEEDVIRIVRERDPSTVAARRAADYVESQRIGAALYPNPSLAYNREVFDEREDIFQLQVPIDLSGRRRARDGIVHANGLSARATASLAETAAVVGALKMFYRALAESERERAQAVTVDGLREAARVVTRRKEEGYSAGYDEARIAIELEVGVSALEQTRIRRMALLRELAALMTIDVPEPSGVLFPGDPDTTEPQIDRTAVALYDDAARTARAANESWTWIPPITLSGGARLGAPDTSRIGYVAGVSIALPIFARGQDLDAQSSAARDLAEARADAVRRTTHAAYVGAAIVFAATHAEAKRFREATLGRVERLETSTMSGYREGQRTVVELIDARRVRNDVTLRALELDLSARLAEIDLRAAKGAFE